jgi:hypothetical protein
VLAQTLERVYIPPDLVGLVEGRSTWARVGVSIHVTAPKIDPGFDAQITLEMFNFGKVAVDLRAEVDKPAQLILLRVSTPLREEDLYGRAGHDVFQGQTDPIPHRRPAPRPRLVTPSQPAFERYIGIDYSGAETPTSSLKGLQVFVADRTDSPEPVSPPPGLKKYWTRRAIAEWLVVELSKGRPTIVGIDHGFSFPLAYFKKFGVPHDWSAFLDDFVRHWPTDGDHMYVDFVRDGKRGAATARAGSRKWRRVTEIRSGSAKSVFHFDVQGSVAKSTHSGIPWLRYLRQHVHPAPHFWPVDGWNVTAGQSAIVEVYPRLWSHVRAPSGLTSHQEDAFRVAEWLRVADQEGELAAAMVAPEDPDVRAAGDVEGWILGTPMAPLK